MTTVRTPLALVLIFLMSLASAGSAFAGQAQHIVGPAQLSATVADRAAALDADRASVREALARPQVQETAARMGLDLNRLSAAVETMSGAELAQAASTARQVNEQLVGGASTVVISTTTIIIILLAVILLVVIAK